MVPAVNTHGEHTTKMLWTPVQIRRLLLLGPIEDPAVRGRTRILHPNVAYPRRGKTRQSAPNVGARRLGQDEQYLTVRDILFRVLSSRHGRDYHASAAIFTGLGMQR